MAVLIFLLVFVAIVGIVFVVRLLTVANRAHRSIDKWLKS